jgi:hypothetical protein
MYVRPTTRSGSLKPGYSVSARLSDGLCVGSSVFVTGVAYECVVGDRIYGPCWPVGAAAKAGDVLGEVFCLGMPWERSGVEIGLQKSVRPSLASTAERPSIWGVELTSGQRCHHTQGAVSAVGGVPVRFVCGGKRSEGPVLLGQPDKAQAR